MEEKIISVYDLTTDMAVESTIGEVLNKQILEGVKSNNKVIVDFKNVNVVLTAFLNASIGNLFHEINKDIFEKQIKIINLPEFSQSSLERVIKNAEQKYAKAKSV